MTRYCLALAAIGGTLGIIAGFFILLGLHTRLEAIESAGRIIAAIMGLVGGGGVLAACAAVDQKRLSNPRAIEGETKKTQG